MLSKHTHNAKVWHKGLISQLEPRLMYDGAAAVAVVEVAATVETAIPQDVQDAPETPETDAQQLPVATDSGPVDEPAPEPDAVEAIAAEITPQDLLDALETDPIDDLENMADSDQPPEAGDESTTEPTNPEPETIVLLDALEAGTEDRVEIAFIDASVQDADTLEAGIDPLITIYRLDAASSGLSQMADILAESQEVDAIHLFSHGSPGDITLGSEHLSTENIEEAADELALIGQAMDESGDILLYGCSIGQDTAFISQIAELTGADVSASDDATGASALGGDWDLEVESGVVEIASSSPELYSSLLGLPSVSGLNDKVYTENDGPVVIDGSVTITNGTSYDGKYIEFSLTNTESSDQLTLTSASDVNASGAISIDGTSVYLGNGSGRDAIGVVDSTYNGENGQKIRINFVSGFANASFETGTIEGWTAMNQSINLGVTQIAGFISVDTSDYSDNANADNDDAAPSSSTYSTSVTTSQHSEGSYALQLTSSMTTAGGYDVVHGPAVYSSEFEASSGDVIYFDWKAVGGSDDWDAFGYIVNTSTGDQVEVLDATGPRSIATDWATKATTIGTSGNYRFVFVNGTYDASGGKAAGGQLFIDNVKVFGNKVNDAVVSSIASQIAFENTSEDPNTTSRTYTVTAVSGSNETGTGSCTLSVIAVNDQPLISGPDSASVNEDTSVTISGIEVSDVDSSTLTVNISSARSGTSLTLGSSTGLTVDGAGTNALQLTGTAAAVNTALATLSYKGGSNFFGDDPLTVTVEDESGIAQPYRVDQTGKFYNPDTGHYYEFVSSPNTTWAAAKTAAESRTLYGLNGYLATIGSQAENDFINPKLGSDGWMGASDEGSEGVWKWVTGPEAGTQFWSGLSNGSTVGGQYANWGSGEPNDAGNEDYAQFYRAGGWNDLSNTATLSGYVVEYGGEGFGGTTPTSALLTVTVNPVNDAPVVQTTDVTGAITEQISPSGNIIDSGTIAFTDVDLTDNHSISTVTSTGTLGTLTATVTTDTTGSGTGGVVTWNYSVDAGKVEYLAEGQTKTEEFTFNILDGEGGSIERVVSVTITGTNDAPVVETTDVTGAITEQISPSGNIIDSGTIAFTDIDLTDTHIISTVSPTGTPLGELTATVTTDTTGSGTGGAVTWNYSVDAADVEYLAEGETKVEVFTFNLLDGEGGSIVRVVSVTITGAKDAPVITVEAGDSDAEEILETDSGLTTAGSLSVQDLDTTDIIAISKTLAANQLDADGNAMAADASEPGNATLLAMLTATVQPIPATVQSGTIEWNFNSGSEPFNYIAKDEQLILTYTLTATDSEGETDTQDITITITGTNDTPTVIVIEAGGFTEEINGSSMVLTDSGTVTFDDLDGSDTIDISFASNNDITWSGGSIPTPLAAQLVAGFSSGVNGADAPGTTKWNYSAPGVDLDFLSEGETITFSYTITATDNNGASATDAVTITITGTNDTLVASGLSSPPESQVQQPFQYSIPANTFSDVDINDSISYSVSGLPNGLTFSAASLQISGTPTEAGTFLVTVTATDGSGASKQVSFSLTIDPAPITLVALPESKPLFPSGGDTPPTNLPPVTQGFNDALPGDTGAGMPGDDGSGDSSPGDLFGEDAGLFDPVYDETNPETAESDGQSSDDTTANTASGEQADSKEVFVSREVVRVDSAGQIQFDELGEKNTAVSLSVESLQVDTATGALVLQLYTSSQSTISSYTATLADGSPLPQWLSFDPIRGTITGRVPEDTEEIELKIEVTNSEGNTEILQVTIHFDQGDKQAAVQNELNTTTNLDDTQSPVIGLPPLSTQILQAGQIADNYGADLLQALA